MVSKIDMRTTLNPGEPCPFMDMHGVRCRRAFDKNQFGTEQFICECETHKPAPQTKVV